MKKKGIIGTLFLILISFVIVYSKSNEEKQNIIPKILLEKEEDIIILKGEKVKPVNYVIKNFYNNNLDISKKKLNFISIILPEILMVKTDIETQKEYLMKLEKKEVFTEKEKIYIKKLKIKYRSNSIKEIIEKMVIPPISIILAQGITESGWGTSRFFAEGNNVFGVWTYREDLPRIKSLNGVRGINEVYLRKFNSIKDSIENYFYNISVGNGYKNFREKINQNKDKFEIIKELKNYSEEREEYVKKIENIIKYNELEKYEKYQLINYN
ncbi:Bax protein [Hypnocyclicus thermotrophus]|uniref:Bax protein n=1 Tax=Hypnocyclicus thermotrophus TaxID=1627895 RepID=A0AA46DZN4_9FUSO|nr:glucosaminidase domain-containing protein [Hypnocyclicus thermotrophus]TDT71799.1 Bax protein [Hypnocyclicus thermotrophus]